GVYETVNTKEELQTFMEEEREKIEMAWQVWKDESYSSIGKQSSDKYETLMDLEDDFYRTLSREEDNIYKTYAIIAERELIFSDDNIISDLIKERRGKLKDYVDEFYKEIKKRIEEDKQNSINEIENKR
ncbi:hypothetical protein, partial [Fischerella thermalis]|uniref:hypothetical protein n=1 Tax=Fischerella thermalis TaxID=372787 RepID=UPI000CC10B11